MYIVAEQVAQIVRYLMHYLGFEYGLNGNLENA